VIDEACSADTSGLVDYVEQISGESDFLGFGPGDFGITVEEEEGILEDYRSSKNKLYLIARISDGIVCTISFEAGSRPRMAHCGGIGMSVRQHHWREGVGSALIDELVRWCHLGGVVKKINLRFGQTMRAPYSCIKRKDLRWREL
jgi:GNAT superfamily N-acetyltransferase|tara:strand:- start:747 stop:1181 length:435 start_codon:yes stop_codon:yes gene_type:complete